MSYVADIFLLCVFSTVEPANYFKFQKYNLSFNSVVVIVFACFVCHNDVTLCDHLILIYDRTLIFT